MKSILCECCGTAGAPVSCGAHRVCRSCLPAISDLAGVNGSLSAALVIVREEQHPAFAAQLAWLQGATA